MKNYDSYKGSGIEWIGEIPSHWKIVRMKHLVDYSKYYQIGDGDHGSIKPEMYRFDNGIPYIRVQNLTWNGVLDFKGMVYISEEVQEKNLKSKLIPNDILIAKTGATVGKLAIIPEKIEQANTTSSVGKVTVNQSKFNSKYVLYSMMSRQFSDQIWIEASQKSAQPGFNVDDLIQFQIAVPNSLEEQTSIASYLERRTAKIDELLADKKRLLELYEEEKTAIINQAVTKGLNSDAPLKDSGIEWLGEIPEHWEVKRFKYYFELITEKVEKDLSKIGLENIESKTGKFIETDTDFSGKGIRFKPKDILYGKLRPYLAKVWLSDFDGQAVGDFYVFRTKGEVLPTFAKYRIIDTSFIEVTNSSTYGSKMPRVSWEFIADLPIALPNIKEQQSIVQQIETECNRIDSQVVRTKKLIELLKEYREALISEVVTGKVKVVEEGEVLLEKVS